MLKKTFKFPIKNIGSSQIIFYTENPYLLVKLVKNLNAMPCYPNNVSGTL